MLCNFSKETWAFYQNVSLKYQNNKTLKNYIFSQKTFYFVIYFTWVRMKVNTIIPPGLSNIHITIGGRSLRFDHRRTYLYPSLVSPPNGMTGGTIMPPPSYLNFLRWAGGGNYVPPLIRSLGWRDSVAHSPNFKGNTGQNACGKVPYSKKITCKITKKKQNLTALNI